MDRAEQVSLFSLVSLCYILREKLLSKTHVCFDVNSLLNQGETYYSYDPDPEIPMIEIHGGGGGGGGYGGGGAGTGGGDGAGGTYSVCAVLLYSILNCPIIL